MLLGDGAAYATAGWHGLAQYDKRGRHWRAQSLGPGASGRRTSCSWPWVRLWPGGSTYRRGDIASMSTDPWIVARDRCRRRGADVSGRCSAHDDRGECALPRGGRRCASQALTQHLFLDSQPEHHQRAVGAARRPRALRTRFSLDLDGVPMHFTVYVSRRTVCVYDSCTSPP